MSKNSKIIHQRSECIGCGMCASIAPQTWKINEEDGKADLIGAEKKGGLYITEIFDCDLETNKMVEDSCPMGVVKIES
ncbi:hypothetical protein A2335_02345 [Candidatus Peregrinibacteria bacterium RIFOXYB2_FULL_32_7]|nr:MAG: hypothetical protein A2335_02345 [Candidatus Peregrinibacteria bacterium RIFOXYB2_FULL_32_7]